MDVLMPQLGETVAEGKIVKWFKSAGDAVKPGENLFEIETDKTSMEVPSTYAGTLDRHPLSGRRGRQSRRRGGGDRGGGARRQQPAAPRAGACSQRAAQSPLVPAQAGTQSQSARVQKELDSRLRGDERRGDSFAYPNMDPFREVRTPDRNFGPARLAGGGTVTPLARRLAGERGIDLANIKGSGPHGRIVAADVERSQPARGGAIATGAERGAGQGAVRGRGLRGSAARRHARDHRQTAGRGQADHSAFLSRSPTSRSAG